MYAGFLTHQRMAYVDLFQPPMKGPFEIPNPRVCFTGDKVEPDDWEGEGRMGEGPQQGQTVTHRSPD